MVPAAGAHRLRVPEADPHGHEPAREIRFSELVDRHAQELYAMAHAMLGNRHDAEEALQETFLGAYRGLAGFAGHASPRTWLASILVRQVARVRRAYARRHGGRASPFSLDDGIRGSDDPALRRPPAAAASDAAMDLATLLNRLSPEHRDVLVLRELRGMSYDEIAHVLGVPRGTVESRLHRARQTLRRAALGSETAEKTKEEPHAGAP